MHTRVRRRAEVGVGGRAGSADAEGHLLLNGGSGPTVRVS